MVADELEERPLLEMNIALLGDSIVDNRSYTGAEPDVVTHLRGLLPAGARATLLAVDGATTRSMPGQVSEIPADATHLVVSIGGNDALGNLDLLEASWPRRVAYAGRW